MVTKKDLQAYKIALGALVASTPKNTFQRNLLERVSESLWRSENPRVIMPHLSEIVQLVFARAQPRTIFQRDVFALVTDALERSSRAFVSARVADVAKLIEACVAVVSENQLDNYPVNTTVEVSFARPVAMISLRTGDQFDLKEGTYSMTVVPSPVSGVDPCPWLVEPNSHAGGSLACFLAWGSSTWGRKGITLKKVSGASP